MKIAVLGMGGVGYAIANLLAAVEHHVIGVDIDAQVVKHPRADASVQRLREFYKPTIDAHLTLTTEYQLTENSDMAISCISAGFDGIQLSTDNIKESIIQFGAHNYNTVFVVSGTLPLGASNELAKVAQMYQFEYCYHPLMIVQGDYVGSYMNPPYLVFGVEKKQIGLNMIPFFVNLLEHFAIPTPPCYVVTPEEAELTKLVANAFIMGKMSFANWIGNICEELNTGSTRKTDGDLILRIIGHDQRIGHHSLRVGFAIGGLCFPRDLQSLITSLETITHPALLKAIQEVNEDRWLQPITAIKERFPDFTSAHSYTIGVLGTAYKTGIADERGSKTMQLVDELKRIGHDVYQYDPNFPSKQKTIGRIRATEIIIITTGEQRFQNIGSFLGTQCKAVLDFSYNGVVNPRLIPDGVAFYKAGIGWINDERR